MDFIFSILTSILSLLFVPAVSVLAVAWALAFVYGKLTGRTTSDVLVSWYGWIKGHLSS